jgi:hypothetical protein
VRRDGRVIGEAEWSGAVPSAVTVDPGEHEIVVVAPGKKAWTTKVTLAADGKTTALVVPELDADELADRAPLNPASATGVSLEAVNTHDRNVQRGIGIAVGGVGLVSILVSIPFGARGINLNKTAASECPTNSTCTMQGQSDSQSAVTSGLVSTLLFSIGAGVVVGGAVVFFTAPSAKPKTGKNFQLVPEVGRGSGGMRLVGSF